MKPVFFFFLVLVLASCSRSHKLQEPIKHYPLTGSIVSVNPTAQTASVAAAAIPNYMEAMTMEYPIASRADFDKLHPGDKISATMNVSATGDEYNLSDVQVQAAAK